MKFGIDLTKVELQNGANIKVVYTDSNGKIVEQVQSFENYKNETCVVVVNTLTAVEAQTDVTCYVMDGETVIATVVYDVETYVARTQNQANKIVGMAMMNYCDSAKAYFNK